jgi:DNA-directed RNA polymerase specialized sigma subunit
MTSDLVKRVRYKKQRKELLYEVIACKKNDNTMSPKLAGLLQGMVERMGNNPAYVRFSYNEDMCAYALMMLCRTWYRFNPEYTDNAFAFYATCIRGSFVHFIHREKQQRKIKREYSEYLDCEQHF